MSIPKLIHYCWFGHSTKNSSIMKCINSWKDKCPDYEIVEWSEKNFDVFNNVFTKIAYENEDWASISDYLRLYVLKKFGGIYLDTDVEIIKSFDNLLENKSFIGLESFASINSGLVYACEKNDLNVSNILSIYQNSNPNFLFDNEVYITTKYFKEQGYKYYKKGVQIINGCCIYPTEYFCPQMYGSDIIKLTNNSYSIHHYNASWVKKEMTNSQKRHILEGKILKFLLTPELFNYIYRKYLKIIDWSIHVKDNKEK
ncbi:glycosyl transferase [Apilactobacillus timberlakei]|uniref:glycosyltransferase family 32 protein n=1 Tax=Apilactobacillus timberlakei TaxID=2008380 RepID=UPI0011272C30|nr:glycosyltransferase [Apilactobacillus timberlakei]TPR18890.1 glycosyl transferase [Apilactobacillus timberlakei]TPR20946.1 glycosyl transferase [Apilactobacillus timberlakei]TPR23597.1 glycosyl transferase [Apilactobacillus timberlakei]